MCKVLAKKEGTGWLKSDFDVHPCFKFVTLIVWVETSIFETHVELPLLDQVAKILLVESLVD